MQHPAVILCSLAALCAPALGRIGETLDQCMERYGTVIEKRAAELPQSDPQAAVFSKNSVTIIVEFRNGSAWRIIFRKPKFNAVEAEALLEASAGTGTWSPLLRFGDRDYRLCSDKKRIAVVRQPRGRESAQVEIMQREYTDQVRANAVARAQQPGATDSVKKNANPLPGF